MFTVRQVTPLSSSQHTKIRPEKTRIIFSGQYPPAHLLPRRHSLRFRHPTARGVISRPRTHSIFVPGAAGPASAPLPDESNDSSSSGEEDSERNAASEAASTETEEKGKKEKKRVKLAVVFGLWYAQNVVFNIYNKKVLNVFPYPWLLASLQLLAGSLWMLGLWSLRLQPFPRLSRRFVAALLGPALFHTVGHISACVSFSRVAVSFTHVIKASEPVFSVVLSAALLRQFYPLPVWLSVLPIVAGCCIAAATEVSFDAAGLSGALLSNVGFVLRNIYSKQSLREFADVVDGLNLYGCISVVSLLYLVPAALLVEGPAAWAAGLRSAAASAPSPGAFYAWLALSGVFYHLYNQSSYQALDDITPLTFSVGNTMKRVVVIAASLLVFRNPVRPLNALGSAVAIFGTFLYSQATASKAGENNNKKK
ncbi:xylulose 5-phosphate/phosphate translocator, chloroplastic [Ananas comosus]|uniref:Xylulose 5-phosphate/phosphate translocator, chloroplastic n=1 Tax=Ananas comosus TaxID=4615 RepID=A0A199UYF2_ANACO|nr:xylulose 5-phosphate/phosphate translocator, chloroplastic [Ananas comosus]OAY69651.1 Xylulose 5-phosphate/phosphate translocator, chloroplastic [Ananas comosus]